jgi:hypothetical protein
MRPLITGSSELQRNRPYIHHRHHFHRCGHVWPRLQDGKHDHRLSPSNFHNRSTDRHARLNLAHYQKCDLQRYVELRLPHSALDNAWNKMVRIPQLRFMYTLIPKFHFRFHEVAIWFRENINRFIMLLYITFFFLKEDWSFPNSPSNLACHKTVLPYSLVSLPQHN